VVVESRQGTQVDDEMLLTRLGNLVVTIADVLEDKCMFSIPVGRGEKRNIAGLYFDRDSPCPGYYDASNNTVHVWPPSGPDREPLLERDYIAILAHEYTHCWEFTNPEQFSPKLIYYNMDDVEDLLNIPYAGKLFAEGAANWGESKVLDYFGIDELVENLKPDAHKKVLQGMHPDFSEYDAGYRLMLHLEYHSDFARMLYFLETGEIHYNPREERLHRPFLSAPRDYEEWIYPNWQLYILAAMTNIPAHWGPDAALCIRREGYSRMPHSTRGKADFPKDCVRRTYLLAPRRRMYVDPPIPDLSDEQRASLEQVMPSDPGGSTMAQILNLTGPKGNKQAKQDARLAECLADLRFSCARCSLAKSCSPLDACHLHSCGERGRHTTELLSEVGKAVSDDE